MTTEAEKSWKNSDVVRLQWPNPTRTWESTLIPKNPLEKWQITILQCHPGVSKSVIFPKSSCTRKDREEATEEIKCVESAGGMVLS